MSYRNPHSIGYEVERSLDTGVYNAGSHGDLGAFYNSISNADLPRYTTMFYHPSEHEQIGEVKYSKLEIGYDKGLRNFHDAVKGAPIEAYIPQSVLVPDGITANSILIREPEVMPKKTIIDEILKAQAEIMGKSPGRIMVKATERIEEIHIRRMFRKLEIFDIKD